MSVQLLDWPQPAPDRAEPVTIILSEGVGGRWLLQMPGYWTGGTFVGLKEALAFARRECCGAAATIELRCAGMLCVIHQPRGWPKPICVPEVTPGLPSEPTPTPRTLLERLHDVSREWLGGSGGLRPDRLRRL
jgi:hypothetical protein